jgi:hypothetical protein
LPPARLTRLDGAKAEALHADTEFRPYIESTEQLIQKADEKYKVDEVYMRPTDFSAMR